MNQLFDKITGRSITKAADDAALAISSADGESISACGERQNANEADSLCRWRTPR